MRVRIRGIGARILSLLPLALVTEAENPGDRGHETAILTEAVGERMDAPPPGEPAPEQKGFSSLGSGVAESGGAREQPVHLGRFELLYHAVSDTGLVRKNNEDACGLFIPPSPEVLRVMGVLAVVADGMGGHERGERASRIVLECVGRTYYESENQEPGDALIGAVRRAHEALLEDAAAIDADMGSTCSALLFRDERAYAAHAGDSRIYRWRDGRLDQLTADDSLVGEMMRRGLLTPEQARTHPERSVLLNALGQSHELSVSRASTPCELMNGDTFLICSDGLHGLVTNMEIAESLGDRSPPSELTGRLLGLALDRGGRDNISAIVVRVRTGGD